MKKRLHNYSNPLSTFIKLFLSVWINFLIISFSQAQEVTVTTTPIQINSTMSRVPAGQNGWAYNSVNGVVFRKNSLATFGDTQYTAFYDSAKNVVLGKRKIGTSTWTLRTTQYTGNTNDAHNSISIIVDGAGYLHISWDHHNNVLHYARATAPGALTLGSQTAMIGSNETSVTYPEFYTLPSGDLIFMYRDGASGNGNTVMNRYSTSSQSWTRVQTNLISGEGARNAYTQSTIDRFGYIHVSWVWRESSNVSSNHDMNYAVSYDGGVSWKKSTGAAYSIPITIATAEKIATIPQNSDLINQTSITTDEDGRPYIASYWKESNGVAPQYHIIYKTASSWVVENLGFRTQNFSLAGIGTQVIPISRPQLLVWKRGGYVKAVLVFRDIERNKKLSIATNDSLGAAAWRLIDAGNDPIGDWEPSFDTEIWRTAKKIHIFGQYMLQGPNETTTSTPPQPVFVLEVDTSVRGTSPAGFADPAPVSASGNRLANASFELPLQSTNGNHVLGLGINIPGWRIGAGFGANLVRVNSAAYGGGPNNAHEGNQYLDIADAGGVISQLFEITCPSSLAFGGNFSSRNIPTNNTPYENWTGKIEITTLSGTVVATSSSRDFTAADADNTSTVSDAIWYSLTGTTGTLPTGRYVFKISLGNAGNIDDTYLNISGCFKPLNADGDSYINADDTDSDNDGITNTIENGGTDAYADLDNDGIPNYTDPTPGSGLPIFADANSDGINDAYDTDKDGIINSEDLDSDNDGIADLVEAGGIDTDGNGTVDFTGAWATNDTDGDGLINTYDATTSGVNIANLDTDGDAIPNYKDLDSDNDGVPDLVEAGGLDTDNNGRVDVATDTDGDGLADIADGDVGNDGAVEALSKVLIYTSAAGSTAGKPASYPRANADGMGLPNPYDLDSDGDGILDTRESGLGKDINNDGVLSTADGTTYTDADGNGWKDVIAAMGTTALPLTNTDGRGIPNYLDIDSDDDGITDNVEGQLTLSYKLPGGADADSDGIDDAYDNSTAAFGGNSNNGIVPVNTDNTDVADYLDTDTDNDSINDLEEGTGNIGYTLPNLNDTDNDGLLDAFDIFDISAVTTNFQNNVTMTYMGTNGTTSGPANAGSNVPIYKSNAISMDRDWRNFVIILPIKLISFNASYSNRCSTINWTATNETRSDHYVVERSIDGRNFQAITSVNARGNGGNYAATDNAVPAVNVVYYRLQMVDASGNVTYSKVIAIKLVTDKMNLSIYPNPVVDLVNISFTSAKAQAVTIKVYNASGAQVVTKAFQAQVGTNTLQLTDWNRLPAGDYMIEVGNENFKMIEKISHLH